MRKVDPVERVLNLLTLLHESSQPLSRAEIVERMSRSTPYPSNADAQHQQFTSDRRTISVGLGISIRQRVRGGEHAGQTEYWIDQRDVHLPDLELDDDERLVLALALGALSRTVPHAGEAMLKLGWPGGSAFDGPVPFDFSVEMPDAVVAVMEAARRAAVLDLRPGGDRVEFEPWAVLLSHGAWLALGYDPARGGARTLRLDRLTAAPVVLDQTRSVEVPDLDQPTVSSLVDAHEDPVVAQVQVDEVSAARASLSQRVLERRQVDLFGQVQLRVVVDDLARFRSWLLGLGERAVLLSPPDLRDDITSWLRTIAAHSPSGAVAPVRPASPGRRRGPEPVAARLHRLLSIVPWLYRQRSVAVADIAAQVGATVEQVVRDLTLASMCGVPPYTSDSLYGFWVEPEQGMVHVLDPTLLTAEVRLTARQAASVAVALSTLDALPGGDHQVIERLRSKLESALGELPVRVEFDEPPLLDDVRDAVETNERIRIEYVDLDDNVTEREVDPLKLFVDRANWYVITDDHLRGGERVFRVDRILSATPTGTRFEPRPVTPPAGRTWSWMVPDREVVVRLPPGSDWVLDRYATTAHITEHTELDAGGWLTVWLSVVSERWLAMLLLRCGPGAEVLDPPELIDLPARRAAAILERYD